MAQIGLEDRTSILPKPNVPQGPGIFGPDYSFADNVKLPGEVGVRNDNTIESVIDAVKGAAYYVDTIGFGEASSPLSAGRGVKPLGVNTWMKTGYTCSNGAEMWIYNEGIPTGNALGKRMAAGMRSAGLPQLRGLAPGILEDVQVALDPRPVMSAVFGTGFPVCQLVEKRVGDQDNRIQAPAVPGADAGRPYVDDPQTVYYRDGVAYQKRWAHYFDTDQNTYKNAAKTHCPSGYPKANYRDKDCEKELQSTTLGFCNYESSDKATELLKGVLLATGVMFAVIAAHRVLKK